MTSLEKKSKSSNLVVVIPAHNESTHIGQVVTDAERFLPVIVVDDGSIDETAKLALSVGAKVIRQSPNMGKGAALRAGFKAALVQKFDAVITLDGDGQHDPIEIPNFITQYEQTSADLILGVRNFKVMPFVRRFANSYSNVILRWATGKFVSDNQTGYRLISSRLMEKMLSNPLTGFEFEVDMVAECLRNDFRLESVPIRTIYADEKSHIKPIPHMVKFLKLAIEIRRRRAAIK